MFRISGLGFRICLCLGLCALAKPVPVAAWAQQPKDDGWEKVDGKEASRILEFDVAAEKFTGRYWQYVFEQNGNAIGAAICPARRLGRRSQRVREENMAGC